MVTHLSVDLKYILSIIQFDVSVLYWCIFYGINVVKMCNSKKRLIFLVFVPGIIGLICMRFLRVTLPPCITSPYTTLPTRSVLEMSYSINVNIKSQLTIKAKFNINKNSLPHNIATFLLWVPLFIIVVSRYVYKHT